MRSEPLNTFLWPDKITGIYIQYRGTREHGNTGTREHGNTGTREHGNTGTGNQKGEYMGNSCVFGKRENFPPILGNPVPREYATKYPATLHVPVQPIIHVRKAHAVVHDGDVSMSLSCKKLRATDTTGATNMNILISGYVVSANTSC